MRKRFEGDGEREGHRDDLDKRRDSRRDAQTHDIGNVHDRTRVARVKDRCQTASRRQGLDEVGMATVNGLSISPQSDLTLIVS